MDTETMAAREAILEGAPTGSVDPEGKPITVVMMRGTGPVLIDEPYPDFLRRFQEFMDAEHSRGELFHFITFYSWEVEAGKLHTRHVKTEPSAWTLDGVQAIDQITVDYLKLKPIERMAGSPIVQGPPFVMHGPGKRR